MSCRSTLRQVRVVDGHRVGLVRRLLEHRRKAEELADSRLRDHDVLVVVVDRRDLHGPGHDDVGVASRVVHPVDALAGPELLELDLFGQHRQLVVVQQREQRHLL